MTGTLSPVVLNSIQDLVNLPEIPDQVRDDELSINRNPGMTSTLHPVVLNSIQDLGNLPEIPDQARDDGNSLPGRPELDSGPH